MICITTRTGRAVPLLSPMAEHIDPVGDIAPALARISRFNGHAGFGSLPYSVAQHCCLGADAMLAETGSPAAALAFLLHDAHEAYLGDIATPIVSAIDVVVDRIRQRGGGGGYLVRDALRVLKDGFDRAIYERLRLPLPLPAEIGNAVKAMDLRMLKRERDELLPASPAEWGAATEMAEPIPSIPRIVCWQVDAAERGYVARLAVWHRQVVPEAAAAGPS